MSEIATAAPAETGADPIMAGYRSQVAPMLARLGELAETAMAVLQDPPRPTQGAAWPVLDRTPLGDRMRYMCTLLEAVHPGLQQERSRLALDVQSAGQGAQRQLDRWFQSVNTNAEEAKATNPDEDQADRMVMAIQADDLSSLDTDHLARTAYAALDRGDLRDARVRLKAARLRGDSLKQGVVRGLAKAVEKAMDEELPYRRAAIAELNRNAGALGVATVQIGFVNEMVRRLARDPVPQVALDPGEGASRDERIQAITDSYEHVQKRLREWLAEFGGEVEAATDAR
jgi:hypothetical protein